jgi:chemotaxis family two-component system sensor histidine kinase/response regulator PixL
MSDQAYQFFIEEASELLQVIESGLLGLRQERTTAKVHEIMRAAHSIKGGSASVQLDAIKSISHRLEDIFKALYDETVEIDTELETWLLQAYDCLHQPLSEQIATGYHDPEAALANAAPVFAQIEERLSDALKAAEDYIPSSSDLGIDLVSSIFEVDVAQELERLTLVKENPSEYQVAGELRASAEVFAGFAELLNLPGFGEIARLANKAVEVNPEKAIEILHVALANFQSAREQVLAGDRASGGKPSQTLIALTEKSSVLEESESEANDRGQEINEFNNNGFDLSSVFLDDVFGEVEQPLEISAPSVGEAFDSFALDEVFGEAEQPIEIADSPAAEAFDSLALDEVFGEAEQPLEIAENQNGMATSLSLDDVFGSEEIPAESSNRETAEPVEVETTQSLEEALQSIETIFETLPTIETISTPALEAKATPQSPSPSQDETANRQQKNIVPGVSVKVDLNRLERMNNLVGELTINRNSLSLQNEQLHNKVKELLRRFSRFEGIAGQLRDMSDRMLVNPMNSPIKNLKSGEIVNDNRVNQTYPVNSQFSIQSDRNNLTSTDDFDSLEMDRYSQVHSLLQEVFEEIMQLEEAVEDITLFSEQSNQTIEQQRKMLVSLRDELMWSRMLPLGDVVSRFPRVLRDLSAKYHKPVNLKMAGTDALIDKAVLEKLYDPLLHLVRNAFDHGLETQDIRVQQGKNQEGEITINAYHQGNQTIVEIKDDGAGINYEKIVNKAVERGLLSSEQAASMSQERLLDLIFEPGFSTAKEVSEISGRGVGLDIVRSQLRSIKGTVSVSSSIGKGTTFTLRLPLTLTIIKLLVCLVGSTPVALPSDSIEEIIIPTPDRIKKSGQGTFLYWQRKLIPIYRLADLLEYRCVVPSTMLSKALTSVNIPEDWALPILILRRDRQFFALEIDRLIVEQELVIKPFGSALPAPNYTYGCTILGDGSLIPVIDGILLIERILDRGGSVIRSSDSSASLEITSKPTIQATTVLIVDDSTTLRRTLELSLEKVGYRVLQARDGREALKQLEENSNVQLVICDVEMPNMNGFEFLAQRRRNSTIADIPVAMLTSRSNDKHRKLAMQLGAQAYFTKPYIEQEFLGDIKKLMNYERATVNN